MCGRDNTPRSSPWMAHKFRTDSFMCEIDMGSNVSLAALSENADSVIVRLGWESPAGEGDADVSVLLSAPHAEPFEAHPRWPPREGP